MFPVLGVPFTPASAVVVPAMPAKADRTEPPAPPKLKKKEKALSEKATAAPKTRGPRPASAPSADRPTPTDRIDPSTLPKAKKKENALDGKAATAPKTDRPAQQSPRPAPEPPADAATTAKSVDQPAPQEPKKKANTHNKKAAATAKTTERTQENPCPAPSSSVDPPTSSPADATCTPPAPGSLTAGMIAREAPSDLFTLQVDSPLRPADRRWQLASVLAGHPDAPRRYFRDRHVVAACKFLRSRESSPAAPIASKWQPLAAALELYQSNTMTGDILEARILAGEDTPTIARKCGLYAAVIDTYHDVFFDVRSVLGCTSHINHMVLRAYELTDPEKDQPRLLKLFAYQGGPYVLDDLLMRYFWKPKPVIPLSFAALSQAEIEKSRLWIQIRVLILLLTFQPRSDTERMRIDELRRLHPYCRQLR